MAEFWAYVPEPDELEAMARVAAAATPGMDPRTRKNILVGSFVFMQAHRYLTDRYVRRVEALDCADGEQWVLDALCAPLPNRPALLHAGHDDCPIEDCMDPCLGKEECICGDPAALAAADLRICLSLIRQ